MPKTKLLIRSLFQVLIMIWVHQQLAESCFYSGGKANTHSQPHLLCPPHNFALCKARDQTHVPVPVPISKQVLPKPSKPLQKHRNPNPNHANQTITLTLCYSKKGKGSLSKSKGTENGPQDENTSTAEWAYFR